MATRRFSVPQRCHSSSNSCGTEPLLLVGGGSDDGDVIPEEEFGCSGAGGAKGRV